MERLSSGINDPPPVPTLTRRRILLGGLALVGTTLVRPSLAAERYAGIASVGGGTKPTYLAEAGSRNPVALSMAENLFWNEQLMEHAVFFIALMPGPALAKPRGEAETFKASFADNLAKSGTVDKGNYQAFNRSTIEQVRRFVDYKHRMRDEQTAGKLRSLVWPTFFDHTAREGEYFVERLTRLSAGEMTLDSASTAKFWTLIMGEHAGFIAHLLDPAEKALVAKAMKANEDFLAMNANPGTRDKAVRAVEDILDFKTAAEQGIQTGKIKSIIDPALADHVRREAIKAADDLKRAA
jgi:hypothetical protein